MANYQAPRKKKEWWETALETVGKVADKIIPGDQSSWHSPTPSANKPVSPRVQEQPKQITFDSPFATNTPAPKTGINFNTPLAVATQPKPLDTRAIDERLNKGASWENIAKETNTDVSKVREYSQNTRPRYGIAPKVQPVKKPIQQLIQKPVVITSMPTAPVVSKQSQMAAPQDMAAYKTQVRADGGTDFYGKSGKINIEDYSKATGKTVQELKQQTQKVKIEE